VVSYDVDQRTADQGRSREAGPDLVECRLEQFVGSRRDQGSRAEGHQGSKHSGRQLPAKPHGGTDDERQGRTETEQQRGQHAGPQHLVLIGSTVEDPLDNASGTPGDTEIVLEEGSCVSIRWVTQRPGHPEQFLAQTRELIVGTAADQHDRVARPTRHHPPRFQRQSFLGTEQSQRNHRA